MNTNDFDFDLPEELIAQTPLEKRDASKLLILDRKTGQFQDRHFDAILDELEPGDALVMNSTAFYQPAFMESNQKQVVTSNSFSLKIRKMTVGSLGKTCKTLKGRGTVSFEMVG